MITPAGFFRFVKSNLLKLGSDEEDLLNPRALNALDNVNYVQKDCPNRCLENQLCDPCRNRRLAQSMFLPESGPPAITRQLPSQASIISALYGEHGNSGSEDLRFPEEATVRRRQRRRYEEFEGPPAPPYSLVDPEPELSAPLKDPSYRFVYYYVPSRDPPRYAETTRRRRPQPLLQF